MSENREAGKCLGNRGRCSVATASYIYGSGGIGVDRNVRGSVYTQACSCRTFWVLLKCLDLVILGTRAESF